MAKVLIETAGTEFEQNMADLAMIDDSFREGRPTMINSADLDEAFTNASQDVKNKISFDVNGEERTVTPTTSQQVLTPSTGKNAMTKVTVNAVTSAIDSNITAENIKKDIAILGVTGTYEGGGSSIIPVDFDTVYKRVYLKRENFTIPYTQENILAIEDLIANIPETISCRDSEDNTELLQLETSLHSDNLAVTVSAPAGESQMTPLISYAYNVDSSEETITVEVSAPDNNAHNMCGIYWSNGIIIDENSNDNTFIKNILYSTTEDVMSSGE